MCYMESVMQNQIDGFEKAVEEVLPFMADLEPLMIRHNVSWNTLEFCAELYKSNYALIDGSMSPKLLALEEDEVDQYGSVSIGGKNLIGGGYLGGLVKYLKLDKGTRIRITIEVMPENDGEVK